MPYRLADKQEDDKDEVADKYVILYEHIMEGLLDGGFAHYHDKEAELQTLTLIDIWHDYAEEIEKGMDISVILDVEVERIVNEVFGE